MYTFLFGILLILITILTSSLLSLSSLTSVLIIPVMLLENPFVTYLVGTSTILVHSPNHDRDTATIVRFRGTPLVTSITNKFTNCLDFDGITAANLCKAAGYTITVGKLTANSTTLASDITSTTTSVTLTDASAFKTTSNKLCSF